MYDLIAKALRSLSDDELGQLFRGTTNEALALAVHAGIAAAATPEEEAPRRPPRTTTKTRARHADDEEDVRRARPTGGRKKRKYKPRPNRLDEKPSDQTIADVLEVIRSNRKISRTSVAVRAGYAIWTVDRALRYLLKTRAIVSEKSGTQKLLSLAPRAEAGPVEDPTAE